MALPAKSTENVSYTGNLSADEVTTADATTNFLTSTMQFTVGQAVVATDTDLDQIDQGGSTLADGDIISISGVKRDGTVVAATDFAIFSGGNSKTVGDLLAAIETLFPDSTATVSNGEIRLEDDETGY
ncbi:hypothetical protein LCGC14_2681050, partial [marine sediment metagenome]